MRYIFAVILIISIVITMNIATAINTDKSVNTLDEMLGVLRDNITEIENPGEGKQNDKNTEKNIEEIETIWNKTNEILSLYIEHEELDKTEIELVALKGYLKGENFKDAVVSIDKIRFQLNHIKEKNRLKLNNLF